MGELPTTDPLSILLQKHLPPHIRPGRDLSGSWSAEPTPETVTLAAAGNSWRKVATLARSRIESYARQTQQGQLVNHPQEEKEMSVGDVLEWWRVRLYALQRLRLYSMLRTELGGLWQILASTEVDGQPVADGDLVPFSLRVLRATEAKFRGDSRSTIEQYSCLVQECKTNLRRCKETAEEEMWKRRATHVGLSLVWTLVEQKDFSGAIEVLTPLIRAALKRGMEEDAHLLLVASRVFVLAGDLGYASHLIDSATTLLSRDSALHGHLTHAKTLIHAVGGDFSTAPKGADGAEGADVADGPGKAPRTVTEELNHAILAFYSANLDTAISTLEAVISREGAKVATDAVVFNAATLFELGTGGEGEVVERKRQLLRMVGGQCGEPGVGSSAFKL